MSFPISTTEGEVRIVEKTLDAAGAEVLISEDGELYQAVPGEDAIPYEGDADLASDYSTTSDVTAVGDEPELELAQDLRHADTLPEGGTPTSASAVPFTEPETTEETPEQTGESTTTEEQTGDGSSTESETTTTDEAQNSTAPSESPTTGSDAAIADAQYGSLT